MSASTQSVLIAFVMRAGIALLVLIAGRWLARLARAWAQRILVRTTLTDSLKEVSLKVVYFGMLAAAILTALTILGVPTASLVTSVGVVVVLLGIALQESIGNFAATVLFLLFEPFAVGDLIETGGKVGTVQEIQIFNTVLLQADRRVVVLPNGKIQSDGITNYSKEPILRVDVEVGIGYQDDITQAKRVVWDLLAEDPRILADPPPQIVVLELGDNSVNFRIRPFVAGEDYWDVLGDLREAVKVRFDQAGISIPFPQRDVHLIAEQMDRG